MTDVSMSALASKRAVGEVKFYNDEKGYGFLTSNAGTDVFLHINDLRRCGVDGEVKKGDKFEFEIVPVEGKAPKAAAIKRL